MVEKEGRSGPGPGRTLRARASLHWPWPLILGAGPPIFGPDPRTFRVGPGWPSGQGPLALTMDSLLVAYVKDPPAAQKLFDFASARPGKINLAQEAA
jgi:hypothetical protein